MGHLLNSKVRESQQPAPKTCSSYKPLDYHRLLALLLRVFKLFRKQERRKQVSLISQRELCWKRLTVAMPQGPVNCPILPG